MAVMYCEFFHCCPGTQTEDPVQTKTPETRDYATQCCLLLPQPVKLGEGELEWTTESETAEESDSEFADSSSEEVCVCISIVEPLKKSLDCEVS